MFGIRFIKLSVSGFSKFKVGGSILVCIDLSEKTASTAPAASAVPPLSHRSRLFPLLLPLPLFLPPLPLLPYTPAAARATPDVVAAPATAAPAAGG